MDLQHLLDRTVLTDLITRYTRAVDTRAWGELMEVFTADAVLDYSSVGGPVGPPAEVVGWIEEGLAGLRRHQHVIGQIDWSLHGDEARATAYFTNPMVAAASDGTETVLEVGGYYHHVFRRTPDGWRSVHLVDEVVWMRGN